MTVRVAHLSTWWRGGAGAMVRIHRGLLDAGISSRVHTADPIVGDIPHAHSLPRRRVGATDRLRRTLRLDRHTWHRQIRRAAKANPPFEVFSPPVATRPCELDGVLEGIDLLHLHWVGSFVDFESFFPRVSVPVVWTLHDQNPYLGGFHYQGDVDAASGLLPLEYRFRDIKRRALAGLKLAVAGNSDWNRNQAPTTGVLPETTRFRRIYLPLDTDEYRPLNRADCRSQLGIGRDRFVVGFASAGLGNRRKGFRDLLEALHRLSPALRQRTTLLSFGRQPSRSVREQAGIDWKHLGPLHGGAAQSVAYSAMDLFVIPSVEEAFGQTPLESLACGTPVIGTAVGGIPEIVIDGETGLLVPRRSPHRLAEAVECLAQDAARRRAFGERGRELALQRHHPSQVTAEYVELYQSLLASAPAARQAA